MEAAVRHRKNKKKRKAIEPTEVQLREEAELEHQLFGGPLQVTFIKIRNISTEAKTYIVSSPRLALGVFVSHPILVAYFI
jgi:hypothetical protein